MSGREATTPDGVPLAAFWSRLLARVVDHLVISLLSFALAYRFVTQLMDAVRRWWDEALLAIDRGRQVPQLDLLADPDLRRAFGAYLVISIVVSAVYTVGLLRLRSATLGKLLLGVRVRSWATEGRVSWGQATARWLTGEGVVFAVSLYLVLDYLWPLWDPRRQALHDKLGGTVAVRRRRAPPVTDPTDPWAAR